MALKLSRRTAVGVGAISVGSFLTPIASAKKAEAKTIMIEQTFLKAKPELRADLAAYIQKNWFVMDQEGVRQGIFTSYWLMEDSDENADWDLVVAVGYPQPAGYEDLETKRKFKAISDAHKEELINGRKLNELGAIVRHHRLKLIGGNSRITNNR
jgi:hypothetical protein